MERTAEWMTRTGLVGTDAEGRLVELRAVLRVSRGPDAGATLELEAGTALVGTHARCDLVLRDPTVSRRHAELSLLRGGVRVRDLESKNGTFIGGTRIDDATAPLPFELKVGSTHVEVRAAEVPLPEMMGERASFGALVGESPAMRRVFGVLERVAGSAVPIVFSGEPGTGKTAACAAVHQASGRKGALLFLDPSREIDRAAVDAALGAARGGTLILERVDEWPRGGCEALASALDGDHDARVLATATTDLRAAVEAGRFPRALWFFIGPVHLALPPLRERLEDVPLIVACFLRELGQEGSAPPPELARQVGRGLPGNARELRALVEVALARRGPEPLAPAPSEHAGLPDAGLPYHDAKAQLLEAFERRYLEDLMSRHAGVVLHAAEDAGLGRNHLARLLKKHGLK